MHPSQIAQIKKLQGGGYSRREIAALTGFSREQIAEVLDDVVDLRSAAVRLLTKVPHWWPGTSESYADCVRANFGDVL